LCYGKGVEDGGEAGEADGEGSGAQHPVLSFVTRLSQPVIQALVVAHAEWIMEDTAMPLARGVRAYRLR
jgi:hypothetical protein